MMLDVQINLGRIRANAERIAAKTNVPLLAVIKADAYGLGAIRVAEALTDLGDRLGGYYVFDAAEATGIDLHRRTGRRTVALHGESTDANDYRAARINPVVWTLDRAKALRSAQPVLSLDTGQQRFACPLAEAAGVGRAGDCHEVMTHATRPEQAAQLVAFAADWQPKPFLHAAGSALLDTPAAFLDAVRPGLALYAGAVRVTARLLEVRDAVGPAGYTGFCVQRFGVIRVGYRDGLKPGPCRVNGRPSKVLEVGMQSAFVEIGPAEGVGDEVVLLGDDQPDTSGDGVTERAVALAWGVSAQEVLVRLTSNAERRYVD